MLVRGIPTGPLVTNIEPTIIVRSMQDRQYQIHLAEMQPEKEIHAEAAV